MQSADTIDSQSADRWLPALLLLFVGSGAAALIYEIVWFQMLELYVGSSAVSVGVLLATFMMVLSTADTGADGEIFPGNAANKPFFVVNGGRDPLYPANIIRPYVEHLMKVGGDVVFHIKTEAGHNTDWWLEERQSYETFVEDHPRDPLPDKISWETERIDRYNRAHWLVIDRLGNIKTESALTDTNLLHRGSEYDFGMFHSPRDIQPSLFRSIALKSLRGPPTPH